MSGWRWNKRLLENRTHGSSLRLPPLPDSIKTQSSSVYEVTGTRGLFKSREVRKIVQR